MEKKKGVSYVKNGLRYLKYFAVSSVILVFLQVAGGYWLISSRWSMFLSHEQMLRLSSEINEAESLPDNFIQLYDQLYPNIINASMAEQLAVNYGSRILFKRREVTNLPHCTCDLVYDIQIKSNSILANAHWPGRLQELEYGFAIEKFSSPKKCFDYVMNYQIKNLVTSSSEIKSLLSKDISSMTEDELFQVIMLVQGKIFN
ncbi:MAG: hypothetical protein JNM78_04315 [Cyclobacteriaceae bacterium]|nr:hypothetical protein [Cyclobacteriaceae bacterium]